MRLAAVACPLLYALAGCAPDFNWREVRIDEAGLTQLFPCRPAHQQRSAMLAGSARQVSLYVCDAGQASWALAVADVGDATGVPEARRALADAARANLAVAGPAAAGAAAGERYRVRGRAPDGRSLDLAGRVDARGTRVLQWSVVGPELKAAEVDAFLSSSVVAR